MVARGVGWGVAVGSIYSAAVARRRGQRPRIQGTSATQCSATARLKHSSPHSRGRGGLHRLVRVFGIPVRAAPPSSTRVGVRGGGQRPTGSRLPRQFAYALSIWAAIRSAASCRVQGREEHREGSDGWGKQRVGNGTPGPGAGASMPATRSSAESRTL